MFSPSLSWPTVLCAAIASACLTLAGMHVVIWVKNRRELANLAFAVLAVGVALFSWCSLGMMRAQTPDQFSEAIWWSNGSVFVLVAGLVAFVRCKFRTARPWLGHLTWILRFVTVVVNFVRTPSFAYDRITGLHPVSFLGEQVYVVEGVTSVWSWFGNLSLLTLLCFVVDASYSLWRVGTPEERRRALVIGVPASLFAIIGSGAAALTFSQFIDLPHLEFIPFLVVLAAIGYELSSEVLRAAQLTGELQLSAAALRESEGQMTMAAEAARLGLWIWDIQTGSLWLTNKCRELFAFPPEAVVTYDMFLARIHPDDRGWVEADTRRIGAVSAVRQMEYRVALPDGRVQWISSHLRVDVDGSAQPFRMLGVCIDVTEQRRAELTAHELSGRLINAQEDERRRIARDLHDDLSQRLSVLSVELELLSRGRSDGLGDGAEEIAAQVRDLSSEVHRLSYQLHPAKLDQLGLETAARSWCRDVTQQSGVLVEFAAADVPADVPADIALCVYRVIQEALRNVVRHSQAKAAGVELTATAGGLHLVVSDAGCGFEVETAGRASGLGLLSIRERAHLVRGTITVQSRPGQGTRVAVTIPLTARGPGGPDASRSSTPASAAGVR